MCSKIRGNTDLVNEFLFDDKDAHSLARLLAKYVGTRAGVQEIMGEVTSGNYARLLKFSLGNVSNDMFKIYTAFGGEQCCTA